MCDRIKACLSESALRYILSLESREDGNWLHLSKLTEALDQFYDSHLTNDKPRFVATAVSQYSSKPSIQNKETSSRPSGNAKVFDRGQKAERRCYICGSTAHLKAFHETSKTVHSTPKNAPVEQT